MLIGISITAKDDIQSYILENIVGTKIKIITECNDIKELTVGEIEDQRHFEMYFNTKLDTKKHVVHCGASYHYGYLIYLLYL